MNNNAAVKYFKLYREAHNMDDEDYITNGEVLVWLCEWMDRIKQGTDEKCSCKEDSLK